MVKKLLLMIATVVLVTPVFSASIISGTSGLSVPVSTLTFSEQTFADSTEISNEFAVLGVTFSPGLFYRAASSWEAQGINGPNLRSGDPIVNDFSILFARPVTSAAFASIASPVTPVTITARLGGTDVESFTTEINLENTSWQGFTDIVLDEINVAYTAETRVRIDNIQLGAAVPEPSTSSLGLLALLTFLGASRRRP